MRKLCAYLLIMRISVSCSQEQTHNQSAVYEQEFYAVLNDLIRIELINVSVIQQKTKPVYKTIFGEDSTSNQPSLPPPSGVIYYTSRTFADLITKDHLDSADAEYMYNSIDSTRTITIDSSKVVVPVILESQLMKVVRRNRNKGFNLIKASYGTSCFIEVSTPVFNSNFTKVILSIDYQCGPKSGQGYKLLLEKKRGKWWLVAEVGTWVS